MIKKPYQPIYRELMMKFPTVSPATIETLLSALLTECARIQRRNTSVGLN